MLEYSELKKLLFIINPVSGRKTILKSVTDIIGVFYKNGYITTTVITEKRCDATEYVINYGNNFDIIVCAGGDGTLNEVILGMLKGNINCQLGYIPCGSTNDFAICHGLSTDNVKAAENIAKASPCAIDLGIFNDSCFTYVAAFGAFSWTSYNTPQNIKNVIGHSAYIFDALKQLNKIRSEKLTVKANGKEISGDYIFGSVCNSTSVAGMFELPKNIVRTDDGKFEVILIREPPSIIEYQSILHSMFTQEYEKNPYIEFFQSDNIEIISENSSMDWSLDGEHVQAKNIIKITNKQNLFYVNK